jgi:hypothetical protein
VFQPEKGWAIGEEWNMPLLVSVGIILLSGALGGIINALVTDNGFIRPREENVENVTIVRPGFLGNILLGTVAAFISWGLYGAYSAAMIYGGAGAPSPVEITVSSVAGAVLIGMGGARWLTNEVDNKLLRTTAAVAAASRQSYEGSQRIAIATPAQAFNIAKGMYDER